MEEARGRLLLKLVYLLKVKDAKDKEVIAHEGIQIFPRYMGRRNVCSPHTHNHVEYFHMNELPTTVTRFHGHRLL